MDKHMHTHNHTNQRRHPQQRQYKDLRQENKHPDGNEIHTEGGTEACECVCTCVCVHERVCCCQSMAPSPALQLIDLSCTSLSFSICLFLQAFCSSHTHTQMRTHLLISSCDRETARETGVGGLNEERGRVVQHVMCRSHKWISKQHVPGC